MRNDDDRMMSDVDYNSDDERSKISAKKIYEEQTDVSVERKDDGSVGCSCERCNKEFDRDEALIVSRFDVRPSICFFLFTEKKVLRISCLPGCITYGAFSSSSILCVSFIDRSVRKSQCSR